MRRELTQRVGLAALAAAAAVLLAATTAAALPPECDPGDPECGGGGGGPVETTVSPHLFVAPDSGRIQDSPLANIDCGQGASDCSQGGTTYSYTRSCDEECFYDGVDTVTLVPSGGPGGFSPSWSLCRANGTTGACTTTERFGCDGMSGANCIIDMYDHTRAQLSWIDTTDPNTSLVSPRTVIGPTANSFTASASDNAGVARVAFSVDGVFVGDGVAANGFTVSVNPGGYTHGSTHTLTAQAIDSSNRADATPASATFTVDRQTTAAITSPAADGHYQSAPEFTFTKEVGASATCSTLTGGSGDTSVHSAACDTSYTPEPAGDGLYRVRVLVTDAVGNTAQAERTFTADDSDPNLTVGSPAEAGRVRSPVTPVYTATDGQPGTVAVTCQYGGGAPAPCGAKALPDGPATLTVKAVDLAGNSGSVVRTFTVDSTGPVVSFTAGPADGSIVRSTSVQFTWTATDGSQPVVQRCKLDGGALGPCSGSGSHALVGSPRAVTRSCSRRPTRSATSGTWSATSS